MRRAESEFSAPWAGDGQARPPASFAPSALRSQKNSSQAGHIFAAVAQVLGQAPMSFWGAELLAGQDEGALGWITINYVLGLLVKVPQAAWWGREEPGCPAWPVLEPGARLCSVFLLRRVDPASGRDAGGRPGHGRGLHPDHLCAWRPDSGHEHPGLLPPLRLRAPRLHPQLPVLRARPDAEQAAGQAGAGGLLGSWGGGLRGCLAPGWCSRPPPAPSQSSPAPRVRHPCYHSGYVDLLSLAPLYESPCVQAEPRPDFPPSLPVEGTGNPGACVSAIRELFNFSSCHGREDCAFNGVYQPPVRGQFYVSARVLAPGPRWTGGLLGTGCGVWAPGLPGDAPLQTCPSPCPALPPGLL